MGSSNSRSPNLLNSRYEQVALVLETLRHVSVKQLIFLVKRRMFSDIPTIRLNGHYRLNSTFTMEPSLPCQQSVLEGGRFKFLNCISHFTLDDIDWFSDCQSMLWRYNLHYFDYLKDDLIGSQRKRQLILNWIEHNKVGSPVAWDSYTTSLRVINWIKWFEQQRSGLFDDRLIPDSFERSLNLQGTWLAQNIEHDIAANHLFKNVVALLFWSHYFGHRSAKRWREKSLNMLWEQLDEQFLEDGGHYERSPMYHSLMLEFCLDTVNLLRPISHQGVLYQIVLRKLTQVIERGLSFLSALLDSKGDIPLLHDSAHGIANSYSSLVDYAERLGIGTAAVPDSIPMQPTTSALSHRYLSNSGYVTVSSGNENRLLVDVGQVSPDYQPGHHHCSLLSYELTVGGHAVITDSGVSEYQSTDHRRYARSTRAHNTIQVDDLEQSQIWGDFRVAKRAKVEDVAILSQSADTVISATLKGFHQGNHRYVHHRKIGIDQGFSVALFDRVSEERVFNRSFIRGTINGEARRIRSYVHIAPNYTTHIQDNTAVISGESGEPLFVVKSISDSTISIEMGWLYPEFGKEIVRQLLVIETIAKLPVDINYIITPVGG